MLSIALFKKAVLCTTRDKREREARLGKQEKVGWTEGHPVLEVVKFAQITAAGAQGFCKIQNHVHGPILPTGSLLDRRW
jgi:hypothetical protein